MINTMKTLLVSSIVVITLIGGVFSYSQLNKQQDVINVLPVKIDQILPEDKIIEDTPIQEPITTVTEDVAPAVAVTVAPQKTLLEIEKEQNGTQSMTDYEYLMLKYLIKNSTVYTFTNSYLKVQYPEKFTSDKLESTLQYIATNYISYKNDPNNGNYIYKDFHW